VFALQWRQVDNRRAACASLVQQRRRNEQGGAATGITCAAVLGIHTAVATAGLALYGEKRGGNAGVRYARHFLDRISTVVVERRGSCRALLGDQGVEERDRRKGDRMRGEGAHFWNVRVYTFPDMWSQMRRFRGLVGRRSGLSDARKSMAMKEGTIGAMVTVRNVRAMRR
jgi:hypothetical protein